MAGLVEHLRLWIALASLEHLQDPHPHQRDRRNEHAKPPRQAPGLRHHDDPERRGHPRRRARRLQRCLRLNPPRACQGPGLDARLTAAPARLGAQGRREPARPGSARRLSS